MSPEEKEYQKRDDALWVLSTEQGRRFMFELLGVCGVYRSQEGDSDARTIQEGARRIGLHIIGTIMEADEMLYVKMQLEARNRKLEEISNDDNSDDDSTTSDTTSSTGELEYDFATGGYDSGASLDSFI